MELSPQPQTVEVGASPLKITRTKTAAGVQSDSPANVAQGQSVVQNFRGIDPALIKIIAAVGLMLMLTGIGTLTWATFFIVNPMLEISRETHKEQLTAVHANTDAITSMAEQCRIMASNAARSSAVNDQVLAWIDNHVKLKAKAETQFEMFMNAAREHNRENELLLQAEKAQRIAKERAELKRLDELDKQKQENKDE
jgi:hypothetical protein